MFCCLEPVSCRLAVATNCRLELQPVVTNIPKCDEEICRKIQVAIGEYDELLILVKTESKVVWLRLNIFWFIKDDPKGHSERKKEKR